MRTVRDGVFGAIGRRRRTGQCVVGWTRVAPECGGQSRSTRGTGAGNPTRAMAGSPRGCLGGGSALLLGVGDRAVPLHRGPRALGLRPERPAHFLLHRVVVVSSSDR